MAEESDTDRLASELLGALRDVLSRPLPGTGQAQSQPQVDEHSLLCAIKEILTRSLAGTKGRTEEQTAPAARPDGSAKPKPWAEVAGREEEEPATEGESERVSAAVGSEGEDSEALRHRQEGEREAVRHRHEQEREAMRGRRDGAKEDANHQHELERDARESEHKRVEESRRRGRGTG